MSAVLCQVCGADCEGRWTTIQGEPRRCMSCMTTALMDARHRERSVIRAVERIERHLERIAAALWRR
jgi:phosphoribosyl-dephospho-CoA transferase